MPRPASAAGAATTSGARCTTAARATGACSTRRSRIPNYTRLTRADADAMFAYLQSLAPVAQAEPAARAALSVRPAGRARGLARALLSPGAVRDRPARGRRMEPRRLPGRDARPLQRLPLAPQRLRRDRRPARPRRRPDPDPELVRAFAAATTPKPASATGRRARSSRCSRPASRRAARCRGRWPRWSRASTQYLSDADLARDGDATCSCRCRRVAPRRRDRRQPRQRRDARASAAPSSTRPLRRLPRRATATASPAPIRRSPATARSR